MADVSPASWWLLCQVSRYPRKRVDSVRCSFSATGACEKFWTRPGPISVLVRVALGSMTHSYDMSQCVIQTELLLAGDHGGALFPDRPGAANPRVGASRLPHALRAGRQTGSVRRPGRPPEHVGAKPDGTGHTRAWRLPRETPPRESKPDVGNPAATGEAKTDPSGTDSPTIQARLKGSDLWNSSCRDRPVTRIGPE